MRRNITATLPLAALLVAGCAADAAQDRPQPTDAGSPASVAASPQEAPARVQRLDRMPSATRPDCANGRVTRVVPGHSGWDSLKQAAVGLLRHPDADHAAVSPANGKRVTIVLYRSDDTIKAKARLRRLDDRWFPDSIAVCQSTVR
jgi:hypothetical protein